MQTYLLVSGNNDFLDSEILKVKKRLSVSPFNYQEITGAPSIGIDQVREIRKLLIEKPYGGGGRLVVIKEIDKTTPEAANALLKLLEEPPEATAIVLTARNSEKILPTILSRSQIIEEKGGLTAYEKSKDTALKEFLMSILSARGTQRWLLWPKNIKSREEALHFLDNLLVIFESCLHNPDELPLNQKQIVSCLKKTIGAKSYLERNVSYKATLDILFLGFPEMEPYG